ncbi:hypothetical protein HPB48_021356 [Haemaphysalis longicornis]|uniref:Carbohydrate sulfotransferase n=1 Tax=Haemaphysalis longicornis TaxID=44386 RepID=A0A9J6H1G8_HAELO|nr:hypothetical protein HPB48_021356 [Haemaphysalis longicornis]
MTYPTIRKILKARNRTTFRPGWHALTPCARSTPTSYGQTQLMTEQAGIASTAEGMCVPFIWSRGDRFGFCPIPKAATSSLKTLILEAERIKDPGDNADEIFLEFKKRFPSVLPCPHWDKKLGSEYGKLIIVRHPFERLVSAYVDKIRTTDPFIPGAKAMYKHGFVGKGPNGTFTFSEFVSNILKEPVEKWDEHWAPFTTRCRPCSMRYNVIAKVETLDQDLKTLLPRIGLQRWTFPARNVKTRSNESSRKEFSHYISELPRQQLLQLHAIYMYDFELFGYKLAGYTDPVL